MLNLTISFQGPFVYSIKPESVNIYAARCLNHKAGVFTANKEYPVYGLYREGSDYVYQITSKGIENNLSPINYLSNAFLRPPANTRINPALVYFRINVPRPTLIYGTNTAETIVMKPSEGTEISDFWPTGARFYYEWNRTEKIYFKPPFGGPTEITPPSGAGDLPSALPPWGDITFEYGGPNSDDSEHQDAIECFAQMAQLVNLDWWLKYEQTYDNPIHFRTGGDCKALALMLGS